MCLIAILYRVIDDCPLIVAANREEAYERGGTSLDRRDGPIPFVAGVDPAAGGTWLGINASWLMVAVTNRRKSQPPEQPRSRGLLVKDLLGSHSAREASQIAARELGTKLYAGCNIVCRDADSLWIVYGSDWLRMRSLAPGYHILTNDDANDPHDAHITWAMDQLHESAPRMAEDAINVLRRIASHSGPPNPICLHGSDRGTVASTLLCLHDRKRRSRLWHADGPPDRVAYRDRSDLLWGLEESAETRSSV